MKPETAKYLSPRHAAEILDTTRSTIKRLYDAGEFPAIRFGRTVRIERTAFEQWLQEKRTADAV